jgi:hypothetical protein
VNPLARALLALRCVRHRRTPFSALTSINCANGLLPERRLVDFVTIAFNNERVIAHQIRLVKKYLRDPHHYLIADNSSEPAAQERICALCRQQGVSYLRLPPNPHMGRLASDSHGLAMNWVWEHFLRPRRADCFGFLDHDIYPIRATSVMSRLQAQPFWGHLQERGERWYLWPGLCFFSRSAVEGKRLNFRPIPGLDTGGGNWPVLYADRAVSQFEFPPRELRTLREGDCIQADRYEILGDWLHTYNASGWMKVAPKEHLIDELLARY